MIGPYFYNKSIKKSVSVFGTLFNNISVKKVTTSGKTISSQKVPLSYGPRERFLSILDAEDKKLEDRRVAIKLPRMSFQIEDLSYDPSRKLNKLNKCLSTSSTQNSYKSVYEGVPYNITMSLNILARTQDDGLQIIEQILPYFTPDYTVTANNFNGSGSSLDIPINLDSVSIPDEYEGDFTSVRDVIMWTLTFTMRVKLTRGSSDQGFITDVDVDLFDYTNGKDANEFLEEITYEADSQNHPSLSDQFGNHLDDTDDDTFTS